MSTRPDRIDPEIANEFLSEERAVLLDARPDPGDEVIEGAVRVSPAGGTARDDLLLAIPREKLLIAFCDTPNESSSNEVARRARELGRGDASVLAGGLDGWKDAGLPIVRPTRLASELIETLSDENLRRLGRLAFWLDLFPGASMPWVEGRDALDARLADAPRDLVERFLDFLRLQGGITVPEDHPTRLANLPDDVRARAARTPLDEGDSVLLLRWLTWTQEIPPRQAWWYPWRPFLQPTSP